MGIINSILNKSYSLDVTNGITCGSGMTLTSGTLTISSGNISMINAVDDTTSPIINYYKSRAGGVIASGDWYARSILYGNDGSNFIDVGSMFLAYGGGTVATNRIFCSINFRVHKDTTDAALNIAMLNGAGHLELYYATGTFSINITSGLPIYVGYRSGTSMPSSFGIKMGGNAAGFGAMCHAGDSLDEMTHFAGGENYGGTEGLLGIARYSSIVFAIWTSWNASIERSIIIAGKRAVMSGTSGTLNRCIGIGIDSVFWYNGINITGTICIGYNNGKYINTSYSTGVGALIMYAICTGNGYNSALGYSALCTLPSGNSTSYYDVAIGFRACDYGYAVGNNELSSLGHTSMRRVLGARNVGLGYKACNGVDTAINTSNSIFIGSNSANAYSTGTTTSNIIIGYNVAGVDAESNSLRIGNATGTSAGNLNKTFICGIYDKEVGATAGVAIVDSDSKLGTLSASAGKVLMGGTKPAFSAATYPSTTSQGDILISSSADTVESLAKNTSDTRYLSNTGTSNNPAWAQVSLSDGVTGVLPPANGGALSYTEVTDGSSSINMAANSGYIVNDSDDDVAFILPESPTVGDVFSIVGYSSDGWSVSVYDNDTQDIIYNGTAYNTITYAARYDCVEIRYIASNTFAVSRYTGSPTGS